MTLYELLQLIKKHIKLIIALPIVFALVVGAYAWGFMANTYTASVSMYVLSSSSSSDGSNTSSSTLYSELNASQMLTNDVAELITSNRVMSETASSLGMDQTDLSAYKVSVTSSSDTRLITFSVEGKSPQATAQIANSLAAITNNVAQEAMGIEAVNVIDEASTPQSPSGPPRLMYTAVAFLAGLFIAIAIVVLLDMLDTRVRKSDDIEDLLGIPVIGHIPEMKGR